MSQVTIQKNDVFNIINGDLSFEMPESTSTDHSGLINWKASEIRSFLKKELIHFQQNTLYIKHSFSVAIEQSEPAIQTAIDKDVDFMYGHLKYKCAVILNDTNLSAFYKIDSDKKTVTFLVTFGVTPVFGVYNQSLLQDFVADDTKFYLNSRLAHIKHDERMIKELNSSAYFGLMTSFFRTYADHEIKTASHKASVKLNGTVFKNLNKGNVMILDSSWYTSIVRTEGFLVRGHLRMQPYGSGFSERKLIYIDSFEKHGYVRKAKMLPQQTPGISQIVNQLVEV